ncbi:hypothetical protein SGO26_30025 (plasmid) [Cupriavidus metallidurans]|uniref:hypothetical protein n=1 Tax=Cupriavidus metallidurans TaxID=119219 RepID=UPI003D7041E6
MTTNTVTTSSGIPFDAGNVAEWVGLHYGRNFDAEGAGKRQEWVDRFADAHLKVFEVMAAGFDASSDDTDDCVYWIAAASDDEVKTAIADTGAKFAGEVLGWSLADAEFYLPGQATQISSTLLEKASEYRNRNGAVA